MRTLFSIVVVLFCVALAACSGDGASRSSGAAPGTATSSASLPGDSATLTVQGLSCPLCASNVDKQLLKVPGVQDVSVDLGAGLVKVRFDPAAAPSEATLRKAVEDSGYTLAGIITP